jgi:replicative DNA helicase
VAPHNLEAEQALLGVLLYDNAAYERLTDSLQARHFYEPFHQRLFQSIETHVRKGQLAEPILLADEFKKDPAFEELGGLRYLADLVDRAPPAANVGDYARAVFDLALRRDLIRIGGEIATAAHGGGEEKRAGPRPDRGGRTAALHPGRKRHGLVRLRQLRRRPARRRRDDRRGL